MGSHTTNPPFYKLEPDQRIITIWDRRNRNFTSIILLTKNLNIYNLHNKIYLLYPSERKE